jgi:ATP adenylyltransferase
MDYLWTPWRYRYVTTGAGPGGCIFCAAAAQSNDKETLVVHRAARCFVILNRFPYTAGHLMVVPYAHVAALDELDDESAVELIRLARECERHLRLLYTPDGLNMGLNIGRSAGAGVADHLHLHILPRWTGDVNFLTTVSETRILPETLEITWERLTRAFEQRHSL